MMTNLEYTIDDAQWQMLLEQVAKYFDDLTIKRGFQYYKQGAVLSVTMPQADRLRAVVEGAEHYSVSLELPSLEQRSCTCPASKGCKHMTAALLQYAALQERSVPALVNAATAVRAGGAAAAKASSGGKNAVVTMKAARPSVTADELEKMAVSEWHQLFARAMGPINQHARSMHEAREILAVIHGLKPPLSLLMDQLYELHAHLFTLEKLVKPAQEDWRHSGLFIGYHTQLAMDELLEVTMRGFARGLSIAEESELWPRVTETLHYLREQMLKEDKSLNCFFKLYHACWRYWLKPNLAEAQRELIEKELQQLEAAKTEMGSTLSKLPWTFAQSLMYLYLEKDEAAWELLRSAGVLLPGQASLLFEALIQEQAWSRLANWLAELGPLLGSFRTDELDGTYGDYWGAVLTHVPDAESRMWTTLVAMLPYSRKLYEDALVAHGKWRQWIDYHMSCGREPLDFRATMLKPIEKDAPELLLPFYHQAVERYVLLKNRDSYKAAVKLLKRLLKLYRKLKQEPRWEHFITAFAARHSRLRALQEELRKGGLLQ
ncbi:SWIM zinc finger domain-containing protein [Paenibacillus sp. OV219]|uniref:SWIM zinc finger family protein n=1 Tax=Paenibacillus sp. OV219 TaxID=1884377 RepID=UPI0008C6B282|nr:SWIM zinc finger family protein [Paenibacillus sp. OV219]SEO34024.1 SWIM zinc finger [Paenibacillus sp. OV219]